MPRKSSKKQTWVGYLFELPDREVVAEPAVIRKYREAVQTELSQAGSLNLIPKSCCPLDTVEAVEVLENWIKKRWKHGSEQMQSYQALISAVHELKTVLKDEDHRQFQQKWQKWHGH